MIGVFGIWDHDVGNYSSPYSAYGVLYYEALERCRAVCEVTDAIDYPKAPKTFRSSGLGFRSLALMLGLWVGGARGALGRRVG